MQCLQVNCFRTIIATTPEDLLPTVYLCTNQVAPSHEGTELGIGDATLVKVCLSPECSCSCPSRCPHCFAARVRIFENAVIQLSGSGDCDPALPGTEACLPSCCIHVPYTATAMLNLNCHFYYFRSLVQLHAKAATGTHGSNWPSTILHP